MVPTFAQSRAGYFNLWRNMKVRPDKIAEADKIAKKIIASKSRYQAIENETGVPWFMVGAIHALEASLNFSAALHNGEHIIGTGKKTRLVPAGRGPFATFEQAAIDALTMPPHSLHNVTEWTVERIGYELEKYNGWGYLGKTNSPYLWSYSSNYTSGKYIADHVYSRTAVSTQCGAMVIIARLAALDKSVAEELAMPSPAKTPPPPDIPAPKTIPTQPAPQGGFFVWLLSVLAVFRKR